MKDFYLTLLSDSCLETFPNNKQSNFTVRLNHPIQIDKQNWEVALAEIITPAELLNISENNNYFFVRFVGEAAKRLKISNPPEPCAGTNDICLDYQVEIPKDNYVSARQLITEMQKSLEERFKEELEAKNHAIHLIYGNNSKRVKIRFEGDYKNDMYMIFPKSLAEILGVDRELIGQPLANNKHNFKYGVDLNMGSNRFYVYSDVASYTYIGNITAPILRVIPFKFREEQTHFQHEILNLHYVPVAKSFIDQVHISIKGDTGQDIPFITGKTLIKLHFRHKE